jgi:dipeptidyl aminopeptidase/acylaminoacyl peptidase
MRHLVCAGVLFCVVSAPAAILQGSFPTAQPTAPHQSAGSPSGVIAVPSTVTVDGVPPIPTSIGDAVAPYSRFRRTRLVAWHSTERRILVATDAGPFPQIHDVPAPLAARVQLTSFPDGVAQRPPAVFDPAGKYFVFQKDIASGKEAYQLYRYDIAAAATTLLTDGKSRNDAPVLARRGGRIAYTSTRRDGRNRDLYIVDPQDPKTDRLVAQLEGSWWMLNWSPDDSAILALEAVSNSETYLWRIEVASGQKTALTVRGGDPVRWMSAQFAKDGATVYAAGNLNEEIFRVWRRVGETWTPVTPDGQAVEDFALSPDGRTLAVVIDEHLASRLQFFDASGRPRRSPRLPSGVITDLTWHPKGTEVGFSLAGARTSADVYSVNVKNRRQERWTESGLANSESLPDAEIVRWKSFDDLMISGVLYPPAARFTGPRPVIINVHGGPTIRERPKNIGRSNYFRNELGIAVIYPNVRGSIGFGRTFEELDNGRLRENAVKDIGALLDWIATQPMLDKSRVMIAGGSYGGYVALAAAIAYGDRLKCVNPAFGITDFPSYLESTDLARQRNRNAEYGDPADPETRAFLTRISPLTNAAKLKMPVYFAAGAKDTRIPIEQAERMVKALKANGVPVWYVRFENAGHGQISNPENDYSVSVWAVFLQKFLLN